MAKMFQVYGIGQALIPVLPPPLPFENAPNSNQTNYEIGQVVYTPPGVATDFYIYAGAGNWIHLVDSDGPILSVLGTANQITATNVAGVVTLSIPATFIAPGSIASTTTIAAGTALSSGTTITAGTSITATLGNITATNGNLVLGTAGNKLVIATGANASVGTSAAMTAGTITIATTAVSANSIILVSANTLAGTPGTLSAPAASRVAGTSFDIVSSSNTDTSTVNWLIIN
jgi:hypothetical protein